MQLENFGSTRIVTNGRTELFSGPLAIWFGLRSDDSKRIMLLFKDRFEYWDDYGFHLKTFLLLRRNDEG